MAVAVEYAIQVVTHIGSTGVSTTEFLETASEPGHLAIDVLNRGTRAYRPLIRAQIFSAAGVLESDATFPRGLLYPTTSLRQIVPLPRLAPGSYTLLLVADVGTDDVQGAKFSFIVR